MKKSFILLAISSFVGFSTSFAAESELNLGLNLTEGNSETLGVNAGLASKGKVNNADVNATLNVNYGESEGDKNVDNAKVVGEIRQTLRDPVYGYFKADALTDDIAGIDYRVLAGPGVGTWLIKEEKAELGVEIGVSFLKEKKQGEISEGDTITKVTLENEEFVLRVGQTYSRALSETSKTWQSLEYLPFFDDFGVYLLNFEVGVEAKLTERSSLRLVLQNRFDSDPAPGRDDNDLSLIAGLGLKL